MIATMAVIALALAASLSAAAAVNAPNPSQRPTCPAH
jgi:hypothetical protein